MRGLHRASYATGLAALLVAGALTGGGVALADSYGSDDGASASSDDGSNTRGADGKDGTATTECRTKFSTDVYAPMQCYPSVAKRSDSDSGDRRGRHHKRDSDSDTSTPGASGADGSATDNGAPSTDDITGGPRPSDQYKNPVTQEHHFIPLPNIGYNPLNPPSA
jgi:hypothetical protein